MKKAISTNSKNIKAIFFFSRIATYIVNLRPRRHDLKGRQHSAKLYVILILRHLEVGQPEIKKDNIRMYGRI